MENRHRSLSISIVSGGSHEQARCVVPPTVFCRSLSNCRAIGFPSFISATAIAELIPGRINTHFSQGWRRSSSSLDGKYSRNSSIETGQVLFGNPAYHVAGNRIQSVRVAKFGLLRLDFAKASRKASSSQARVSRGRIKATLDFVTRLKFHDTLRGD